MKLTMSLVIKLCSRIISFWVSLQLNPSHHLHWISFWVACHFVLYQAKNLWPAMVQAFSGELVSARQMNVTHAVHKLDQQLFGYCHSIP